MNARVEFGDFQTPDELCHQVCSILSRSQLSPASIVEPTCGKGAFLRASKKAFPDCKSIIGFEVNRVYADEARAIEGASVTHADFFTTDWNGVFENLPEPVLVIGNPPWVTNSAIGSLNGSNLPVKSNSLNMTGMDAITGKSNFDISEWMMYHLLERLSERQAVLAMLCKTTVARKVLKRAWKSGLQIGKASMRLIDALNHFGAAVDACLLVCELGKDAIRRECAVYPSLDGDVPSSTFAFMNGDLVSDVRDAEDYASLAGKSPLKWRSGVKHDCSSVMELRSFGGKLQNGFGDPVGIESTFLYPMLKSSELARSAWPPVRHMLVTQRCVGEDTARIESEAPATWRYLKAHGRYLDKRTSTIYRNRPRFSVFGVGSYTFAPWKVAISGFYKKLEFSVIGPVADKPVVLDDTCYFLPFESKVDAELVAAMLHSEPAQRFLGSRIFWDAKRPITAGILRSLDLSALAVELGVALPPSLMNDGIAKETRRRKDRLQFGFGG